MIFFYCQSYQAFNLALALNQREEVTVITSATNIRKAAEYLGIRFILHRSFVLKEYVVNRKAVKAEIVRMLHEIGTSELHFSHTQYAVFLFLLVQEGNQQKLNLKYHNFEVVYNRLSFVIPKTIGQLYLVGYKIGINSLYKTNLLIGESAPKVNMFCLDIQRMLAQGVELIDDKGTYFTTTLNYFKNSRLLDFEVNNLFIAQTFDNSDFYHIDKVNQVLELLNESSFFIKHHPKIKSNNQVNIDKMKKLPDFLPVEFLFSSVTGKVISFHSASLITASKFKNIESISLLKIVGKESAFIVKSIEDMDYKSEGKILFPQNFNELLDLLKTSTIVK